MTTHINIYQIFYNAETRTQIDPAYQPLDNTDGRTDWYEFWPIRKFLLENQLNEDEYYGFLSPRFESKTKVTPADLFGFIQSQTQPDIDAFIFSLEWSHSVYFRNIIEQGEACHPKFWSAMEAFLQRTNPHINLNEVINHSQNNVFSNNIVAKPVFWRQWLILANQLFDFIENSSDDDASQLASPTNYNLIKDSVSMKVFIQERLASLLLATQPFKVKAYDCSRQDNSLSLIHNLEQFRHDMLVMDALKIAFCQTGLACYDDAFIQHRDILVKKVNDYTAGQRNS